MTLYRKETVFEGYFFADHETAYISTEPEYSYKGKGWNYMRRWFRDYLKHLCEKRLDEESTLVSFEDLMPRQVYEKLLKNLNTRFRFKIVVEAIET